MSGYKLKETIQGLTLLQKTAIFVMRDEIWKFKSENKAVLAIV